MSAPRAGRRVVQLTAALAALLAAAVVGCTRAKDAGEDRATKAGDSAAAANAARGGTAPREAGTPAPPPPDSCNTAYPLLVTGTGLGPVQVGGRLSAVAARCTVRDTAWTSHEGTPERGAVVSFAEGDVIVLTTGTKDTAVTRVIIREPAFRTAQRIGAGSTLQQVRTAYGPLHAEATDEGVVAVWGDALRGLSFAFSPPAGTHLAGPRDPAAVLSKIPPNSRVIEMWVGGAR